MTLRSVTQNVSDLHPTVFRFFNKQMMMMTSIERCCLYIIVLFPAQEAPLHQELHPPQPLLLLHPESRGRAGERRHPLQPNLAVLQPAVTGEIAFASVICTRWGQSPLLWLNCWKMRAKVPSWFAKNTKLPTWQVKTNDKVSSWEPKCALNCLPGSHNAC